MIENELEIVDFDAREFIPDDIDEINNILSESEVLNNETSDENF